MYFLNTPELITIMMTASINHSVGTMLLLILAQNCTKAGKLNCVIDENEQCGVPASNEVCYCDNNCTNCCADAKAGKNIA